ncbi:MAG: FAD-dependent oxidoreductase [Desulfobacter sp.]|nr:MAG: FAD-dependent oxidoreductase [Desulfobacter sp.]
MHTQKVDTIIIGGGLSGVYAAYLLAAKKKSLTLLEARSRLGGRILSPEHQGFFADLGPSWYWPAINPRINSLIKTLGLKGYPQFDIGQARFQTKDGYAQTVDGYPMEPPGWRLSQGMISLVKGLCAQIPEQVIQLNHPVCEIQRLDNGVGVIVGRHDQAPKCRIDASQMILALPPRLAACSILFTPDLSYDLTQAMLKASTWMAGHAKFFALYEKADWREGVQNSVSVE